MTSLCQLDQKLKEQTFSLIKSFGTNDSSLQGFEQTLEYIQQKVRGVAWAQYIHKTTHWSMQQDKCFQQSVHLIMIWWTLKVLLFDNCIEEGKKTSSFMYLQAKCCGWYGKADWDSVPCSCYYIDRNDSTIHKIPDQCPQCSSNFSISNYTCSTYDKVNFQRLFCHVFNNKSLNFSLNYFNPFFSVAKGCSESIQNWLDENLLFILVVILAIAAVEVRK